MPVRRPAGIPAVIAVTACQIFRIPAEVFKRRAEASPALALELFPDLPRKSQVLGRMLIRDSFLSDAGRVIQFLLSVSRAIRYRRGGVRLTIRLTHQEGGPIFWGISRVVVSQCFQSLAGRGLLRKDAPALSAPRPCRPGGPAPYII